MRPSPCIALEALTKRKRWHGIRNSILWADPSAPGGRVMAKPLVPDALGEILQPWLPPPKPRRFRYPGRKPLSDRKALTGILFVLQTGIPWEDLPVAMGWGCGMT